MLHVMMDIVHFIKIPMLACNLHLHYVSYQNKKEKLIQKNDLIFIGKKTQTVRAKILATVGTMDHDFPLSKHDVCKQLRCPLKNGVIYSYQNNMFVSATYPSVC
jgi:hypothetical protein